jgi:protein involved in polysaccharide export with SLBB domain
MRRAASTLLTLVLWAAAAGAASTDSQYVVGAGDVLQLNVPQVPSLDRQLTVRSDGMIVLPMAGEVRAGGLSIEELESQIVRRLADFNRNVSQASISVAEFRSKSIYVLGRVVTPGKYAFAQPINLFDLIREAGGFTDDALRTHIKIVHQQGTQQQIEYANVEQALNSGSIEALPMVRAGDTVIIAKRNASGDAGADGVQIIGEVRSPSIYALEDVNDLVGMMLLAGGPTETAKLSKVRLVRSEPSGQTVAREYNVEAYLKNGIATQNPDVQPGDTIYVPRTLSTWSRALRNISISLGIVLSAYAVADVVRSN